MINKERIVFVVALLACGLTLFQSFGSTEAVEPVRELPEPPTAEEMQIEETGVLLPRAYDLESVADDVRVPFEPIDVWQRARPEAIPVPPALSDGVPVPGGRFEEVAYPGVVRIRRKPQEVLEEKPGREE